MATLFDKRKGRFPYRDDPLKAPGEVPPGKRDLYERIARKVRKASPDAGAEEVRAKAMRELAAQSHPNSTGV